MSAEETEYELQQLVSSDEENIQPNLESLTHPDLKLTKASGSTFKTHYLYKSANDHNYRSSKLSSLENSTSEDIALNSKLTRSPIGTTRNLDLKPPQPSQSSISKLQNKKDVMDVRQMEQALLHLLDDFHSGKLRAFGKNCSMEQMTAIHEQQEHLARLHFELGAQQELFTHLSEEGLRHGADNMRSLMENLEQLSISIEKLHVINSKTDM